MPEAARTLQKQPSLTVSPPEGEQPKQKGWISRTLRRSDSALRGREDSLTSENRPDAASIREGRLAPSSASRTSLATSDYSGDFEPVDPPPMPALHPPRALAASNASTATSGAGSAMVPAPLAPPPKIPARNPTRSLKESTASSAFLSVSPAHGPSNASATLPLTSLYLVSGLPKSPQTWTLADHDSTAGVHHSEGAVGRFWRAEVLGSSVTPGVGKKKRRGKGVGDDGSSKRLGTLSKSDLGKMLSKSLKLSFPREVEIIASTLQPASTVHSFTFQLPTGPDGPTTSANGLLRTSILSTTTADNRTTMTGSNYPYLDPAHPRPSSTYLGPVAAGPSNAFDPATATAQNQGTAYHGVCLTVWSHADEERTAAIRRTLEAAARHRGTSTVGGGQNGAAGGTHKGHGTRATKFSTASSRRSKRSGPWSATDIEDTDADVDGFSDVDASGFGGLGITAGPNANGGGPHGANGDGVGASTLFLPPNTVFWLPYALTLVSRHPIYDLMRDYLTLSWARFSKDVQSHTLQINKILEYPAPRAGEIIKLDAGVSGESMEVVSRFPGGLDFGRGLVDVNFTMWPVFQCLSIDNVLTICELALAPTGRVLFLSRHPVMLGIAVATIKYLVELRGWNGIALPIVHARDAKIYLEDPGPWIMGLPTESRYITRIQPEICICDLDINFVNCSAPPANVVSVRGQRDKFRKILMAAFDQYYHPDHSIPSEFKEAFPAGRFRPLCKIVTKKGSTSTAVAETIRAPDWWHQTKVVQAFDQVLRDKYKKPPLIKRIAMMRMSKQPARLTNAELVIQTSIRKRASAFVDARDDLETKIGRLSRRLNFLLTESELWRQKFVSFEEYAETLSAEAAELRTKIGKEQRESKRLSGLVQLTAQEKDSLKHKLNNTEAAHREAVVELDRMREEMDEMERERSQMIAEVEAQIERALVSMAFSDNMSDTPVSEEGGLGTSRPSSALSSRASSRNFDSVHGHGSSNLRSFATGTTLADGDDVHQLAGGDDETSGARLSPTTTTMSHMASVKEVDEGDATITIDSVAAKAGQPLSEKALRRFSATRRDSNIDTLNAVDYGIAERTDAVAQKMLQIQQKLEAARLESWQRRAESASSHPRSEDGSVRSRRHTASKTAAIEAQLSRKAEDAKANGQSSHPPSAAKHAVAVAAAANGAVPTKTATNGKTSPTPARSPTPKRSPTKPTHPPVVMAAVLSSTDDSDDYQSAVDVSNPSSDAEQEEADPHTPRSPHTPQMTSSGRKSTSRPNTADMATPRESIDSRMTATTVASAHAGFPKSIADRKQASQTTLHG